MASRLHRRQFTTGIPPKTFSARPQTTLHGLQRCGSLRVGPQQILNHDEERELSNGVERVNDQTPGNRQPPKATIPPASIVHARMALKRRPIETSFTGAKASRGA